MDYCYQKTADGDFELRNRRPYLRSGWDDAHAVDITNEFLLTDFVLIEVLNKIFFVVYQVIKDEAEKECNMVLNPTALLDEGLGILTRTKVQHTLFTR